MATSYTFKPIVTNGLVLYLDSSNSKSYNGGTYSYSLKNNYLGQLINGVGYDNSLTFDGVNDFINFDDDVRLDGFSEYTLSTWVYMNSLSGTYNAIFHKWGSGGYAYFLGIWNGLGSNNQVVVGENNFTNTGGDTGAYGTVSNSSLSTNVWYNVTYTSTISDRKCYINGVLDKSAVNNWRNGNIINSSYNLKIGTHADAPEYTNCKISSIAIYNRALSDNEVLQNYNALKNKFI